MKKDALSVIDMENDFLRKAGALYVKGIKGEPSVDILTQRINNLSAMPFGCKMISMDVHPKEHIEFTFFGEHCLKNTEGMHIHPRIIKEPFDHVLFKGENKHIVSHAISLSREFPEHIERLRKKGIKRVFVAGVAYNFCPGESAIDYARQGFETYVIRDATRSVPLPKGNLGSAANMDKKLKAYGVKLISFADIS